MDSDQTPRWNVFGEDDANSTDTSSPVNRANFFKPHIPENILFAKVESQETDDEEDDDSETAKQKKKKRFARLLNSVFPKIVEREKPPVKEITEQRPTPMASSEETAVHTENTEQLAEDDPSKFDDAPVIVASPEDLPVEVRRAGVAERQAEERAEKATVPLEKEPENVQETRHINEAIAETSMRQPSQVTGSEFSAAYVPPKTPEKPPTQKKPSFSERFYARRKQRKLARKIKRQERVTAEIMRSQKRQIREQERVNQQQQREINELKAAQEHTNYTELPTPYTPATKLETILKESKYYTKQEVAPEPTPHTVYAPEQTSKPAIKQSTPEIAKPKREYLADTSPEKAPDHPSKPKFEARFEQKQFNPIESQPAIQELEPGTTRPKAAVQHRVRPKSNSRGNNSGYGVMQPQPETSPPKKSSHPIKTVAKVDVAPMYKQSIQYGFGAALFILAIGMVAHFLQ